MKKLLAAAAAILMLLVSCAPSALANQYEEYLTSAIKDNPEMVDKELDNVIRQYSEDMKSQQKWRQDPENIERYIKKTDQLEMYLNLPGAETLANYEAAKKLRDKMRTSTYDFISSFYQDVAVFRPRGSSAGFGLVRADGAVVAEPVYSDIGGLKSILINAKRLGADVYRFQMYASMYGFGFSDGLIWFMGDGGYGYLDVNGREVVPSRLKSAGAFYGGYAIVTEADGRRAVIDTKGETVASLSWLGEMDLLWNIGEGRLAVIKDGKISVTDLQGNVIVKRGKYKDITSFRGGVAVVQNAKGQCGAIDLNGKEIIKCKYKSLAFISDDTFLYGDSKGYGTTSVKNGKEKYVQKSPIKNLKGIVTAADFGVILTLHAPMFLSDPFGIKIHNAKGTVYKSKKTGKAFGCVLFDKDWSIKKKASAYTGMLFGISHKKVFAAVSNTEMNLTFNLKTGHIVTSLNLYRITGKGVVTLTEYGNDTIQNEGDDPLYELLLVGRLGDYVSVRTKSGLWEVLDVNGKNMLE